MNIMKEQWKDIKGYEGFYQISNFGKVRSLKRYRRNGKSGYIQFGKILKVQSNKQGYQSVTLYKEGRPKRISLHRLVAQAFISNPLKLPQINHRDENPSNNQVDNLEWCTAKYNNNYGNHNLNLSNTLKHTNKQIAIVNGKKASKPVLQFTLSGELVKKYPSQVEAARSNEIRQDGISDCCRGKTKKYKGFVWKFAQKVGV